MPRRERRTLSTEQHSENAERGVRQMIVGTVCLCALGIVGTECALALMQGDVPEAIDRAQVGIMGGLIGWLARPSVETLKALPVTNVPGDTLEVTSQNSGVEKGAAPEGDKL